MSTASTVEREMLALINQERTSRGLDPLELERNLNESSEDHSTWMLDTDNFSHTGEGGSTATQRIQAAGFDLTGSWSTGENIAWQSERGEPGISDDVAQLHENLMNSPGHRANVLNPDFKYIGIGIETGDMQGFDAVMVTQNFATTQAEVMLDTGATTPPADEVAEPEEEDVTPTEPETPETDVTDTDEPVEETPDTDVTETEEPYQETPDSDVTETEEPSDETPDTDMTETEEPSEETPDTDITESQDPEGADPVAEVEESEPEVPDTDVTDVDDPVEDSEEPETDVTEIEDAVPETPDVDIVEDDMPEADCFDVQDFLAEIQSFVDTLQAQFDQFDWAPRRRADARRDRDDFDFFSRKDRDDDPFEDVEVAVDDMADDACSAFFVEMNYSFDFG